MSRSNLKLKYPSELERTSRIRTGSRGVTNDLPEMPITWPKKTSQCYVETHLWQMGCLFYLHFIKYVKCDPVLVCGNHPICLFQMQREPSLLYICKNMGTVTDLSCIYS